MSTRDTTHQSGLEGGNPLQAAWGSPPLEGITHHPGHLKRAR